MAFVTGTANDQVQLKDALVAVCTANGWTFTGSILSRGNVFVQLWHKATAGWGNQFFGQIGKGMVPDGSALTDPIAHSVGPGGSTKLQPVAYPVTYDIHVFDTEVFMVYWDNQDRHFWIAFGQSSPYTATPGAGNNLWIGATQSDLYAIELGSDFGAGNIPIRLGMTFGGSPSPFYWNFATSAALFWWSTLSAAYETGGERDYSVTNTVFTDRQGLPFGDTTLVLPPSPPLPELTLPGGTFCSGRQLKEQHELMRNRVVGEKWMLPIFGGHTTSGNPPGEDPLHTEIEVKHARYFRLGVNNPRDIITVGRDRWKVYPWYKLNAADGYYDASGGPTFPATRVNHTGSFGWAIRYTGP